MTRREAASLGGKEVDMGKTSNVGDRYTLVRANRYRITNRITKQTYEASALSADDACRKLGWLIGDCFVQEIKKGGEHQ